MLQKRRLTVHPVDAARFCGYDNGMAVGYLNGIDHLVHDPAATDQDEAHPRPSRVLARTYTGAHLADAPVLTQQECVVDAAVNSAAVMACRVTPLHSSAASPNSPYPVRGEGPSKIVFFAGGQRLASVQRGEDAALIGAEEAVRLTQRCPMQCFRLEPHPPGNQGISLDMAAFMEDDATLCACTPQLGRVQTLRFDEDRVCCMGSGRVGQAEVTVLLHSGIAVLCGVHRVSSSTRHTEEEEAYDVDEERQQGQGQQSGTAASASARRAFARANVEGSLHVLHTIQVPAASKGAAPLHLAWSGAATLWVMYEDATVVAVQCREAVRHGDAAEESGHDEEYTPSTGNRGAHATLPTGLTVKSVLHTRLKINNSSGGDSLASTDALRVAHANADPRAPVLHIAYITVSSGTDEAGGAANTTQLHYGAVRIISDGASFSPAAEPAMALLWRLQSIVFEEELYGLRFERGRYHVLCQSVRGAGPLCIATLPRDAPYTSSQVASTNGRGTETSAALTIMSCPESDLGQHCLDCEELLQALRTASHNMKGEADAEALLHRLMHAQHALYALLSRQQQSSSVADLSPEESLPYRLLQRAARLYRQLTAYVLLLRLGALEDVTRPLKTALRLEEATAVSTTAQAEWTGLMRETFRGGSVYQSRVSELAMWGPGAPPLCAQVLVTELGGGAMMDSDCTMASLVSKMDTVTTAAALFILYYSYKSMGCAASVHSALSTAVPDLATQQLHRRWREAFLSLYGLPVELDAWAFACYAVDHGYNPTATKENAPLYLLAPCVPHLGAPPLLKLLAPIVSGLAHVTAVEAVLQLVPTCIEVYGGTTDGMPLPVAMRLLCVALRAGASRTVESLYECMRPWPLLRDLASQPLAYAAMASRDVGVLRGWVEVGSAVADTVEHTLLASTDASQREAVLLSYYILQQRYEEALRMCTAATPTDATHAQRLQVVLSYLRSLLPSSSSVRGAEAPTVAEIDPLLPVDAAVAQPWSLASLEAPLLATSMDGAAREAKASAAVGPLSPGVVAGHYSPRVAGVTTGAGANDGRQELRALRPSMLLASVDAGGRSSVATSRSRASLTSGQG